MLQVWTLKSGNFESNGCALLTYDSENAAERGDQEDNLAI